MTELSPDWVMQAADAAPPGVDTRPKESTESTDDKQDPDVANANDDANAGMLMTEMAFASMRPENMWEKNESLAKRAVKEFNKPGVRDHMEVVSQACVLQTGGACTGLVQYERKVTFGAGVNKAVDGLVLYRSGGIAGSSFYVRFPAGSGIAAFMVDMMDALHEEMQKAHGASAKIVHLHAPVTVEAEVRRFTTPRLMQAEWQDTVAVCIDTDLEEEQLVVVLNDAASNAHQVDPTVPAQMFESTAMGFVLSKDTIATTIHASNAGKIDKMLEAGTLWTLEPSSGVRMQTDEFMVQGLSGFRDTKPGSEGRAFFLFHLLKVTEVYDIYAHDNGSISRTGIFAVKITIQACKETEVRSLIRRLATQSAKGPVRAGDGKSRGFVISMTETEARERAGLDAWDLSGGGGDPVAAQRTAVKEMASTAATAAGVAAEKAALAVSAALDAKFITVAEAAQTAQAKIDELATAQIEAGKQNAADKETHAQMIKQANELAAQAHIEAAASQVCAAKAMEEAHAATKKAAEEQEKTEKAQQDLNKTMAMLARACAQSEERHAMHQESNTRLLQMLTESVETRTEHPPIKEITDTSGSKKKAVKGHRGGGGEWYASDTALAEAGVGRGAEAEVHTRLLVLAESTTEDGAPWDAPRSPRGDDARTAPKLEPDGTSMCASQMCTEESEDTRRQEHVQADEARPGHGAPTTEAFSSADAKAIADLRRPPRPPKPRDK